MKTYCKTILIQVLWSQGNIIPANFYGLKMYQNNAKLLIGHVNLCYPKTTYRSNNPLTHNPPRFVTVRVRGNAEFTGFRYQPPNHHTHKVKNLHTQNRDKNPKMWQVSRLCVKQLPSGKVFEAGKCSPSPRPTAPNPALPHTPLSPP